MPIPEYLLLALSKLNIAGSSFVKDSASGQMVFDVKSPHALTQAAGYLKFIGGPAKKAIYFRGQARLYPGLIPTLFRGIKYGLHPVPKTPS